jgi:hypothetical protein
MLRLFLGAAIAVGFSASCVGGLAPWYPAADAANHFRPYIFAAACLVLGEHELGELARELLAAAGHEAPKSVPSLELNPEHPLVQRLDRVTDDARFERLSLLLFEQAVLAEGRQLEDPAAFVTRLNELLVELGASA